MARKAAATAGEKPKVRKGSKTTLSEANLADLGAERLAAILLDLSSDSHVKRVLRLELFAEAGSEGLTLEISKRLATIGKSSSRIHWRKRPAFARDLDLHRRMIERLAQDDATAALDLMLDLLDLASPTLDRLSQPDGPIGDVFLAARDAIGAIAEKAVPEPIALAERTAKILATDYHAQMGSLASALAPAMGPQGRAHLREVLETVLAMNAKRLRGADPMSAVYKDALRRLADASGDIDAFEATFAPELRRTPLVSAEIARRLLAAGRGEDALATLQAGAPGEARGRHPTSVEERAAWEEVMLEALEATGHHQEAQKRRWAEFERTLSIPLLRAYLKSLPDFDDVEAEDQAKAVVRRFPRFDTALAFFVSWPDFPAASRLILSRSGEINGADDVLITEAARRLEGSYPLAASLLLRGSIQHVLTYGVATRYADAARQLLEAESLAAMIADFGEYPDHASFVADLRAAHIRKQGFRAELEALGATF
ncbi:ferritin [Caulobacter vibrioides]|uniref:DUF6880 family protein n=1 Tax=Caulobacter vibrioides TaxID=155892 RepID=UPI000BB5092F|nr:DUF6880 family protein [Caulobacter vibrioides]ATC24727.1 ferritin [Caulobacter vibrioides]AZH12869.1 ferritin [Caulobacter vibrioides]PLR09503.1 ferritin [Caulobacter vibrioides]